MKILVTLGSLGLLICTPALADSLVTMDKGPSVGSGGAVVPNAPVANSPLVPQDIWRGCEYDSDCTILTEKCTVEPVNRAYKNDMEKFYEEMEDDDVLDKDCEKPDTPRLVKCVVSVCTLED